MAEAKHQYEAMFLLGPVGAAEPERSLQMCRGIIERHGGEIIVIKKWDERKLAYEVESQKRGTYIIAYFRATGKVVTPIERDVKLSEEILRVMVLRADHLNEQEMAAVEPQPIVKEERPAGDDRGDRGDRYDRPRGPRGPRREENAEAGANKD